MKRISLLFLILALVSSAFNIAMAEGYGPGLLNSQHMKEFNIFERGVKIPQILIEKTEKPILKSYLINTVNFERNTVFSSEKLTEIVSDKIGSKLTPDDLSNMKEDITKFYKINGYKCAIVNIADGKAEQGTITFIIYEGPKNRIEYDLGLQH